MGQLVLGTEEVADLVHASHERTFDDVKGSLSTLSSFFCIVDDVLVEAMDKCVHEALFDGAFSPAQVGGGCLG